MMHSPKEMAVWIRSRRQELGLSQGDLAGMYGHCAATVIGEIESGRYLPTCDNAMRLYSVLGYRVMLDGVEFSTKALKKKLKNDDVNKLQCIRPSTLARYKDPCYYGLKRIRYSTAYEVVTELGWNVTFELMEGFTAAAETGKVRAEKMSINEIEAEARKWGLSYGMYCHYKETNYLPEHIRRYKAQKAREAAEPANVIESNIVGAGSHGTPRGMMDGAIKL